MKANNLFTGIGFILIFSIILPMETFGQGKNKPAGPPPWAPAHGYRAKIRHIYFPDHNFYFDVQKGVYVYLSGEKWQISASIPAVFLGIDLKVAAKVELEVDTDTPQKYNADHKVKYKTKDKEENVKGKAANPGKGKGKKK